MCSIAPPHSPRAATTRVHTVCPGPAQLQHRKPLSYLFARSHAAPGRPQALSRLLVLGAPELSEAAVSGNISTCATSCRATLRHGASISRRKSVLMALTPGISLGGTCGSRNVVLFWAAPTRGSRRVATCAKSGAQQPAIVVVESPTKAKKIQGFLGENYKVLASYGHVRDLPSREGSVRPDQDFAMEWQLMSSAEQRMEEISRLASGAPLLLLATDPDREGEAISWHIQQELRRRGVLHRVGAVQRITFTAITRNAITAAMKGGRQVSQALVDAYLARRALDYLVGFHLSPVLWRKLPGAKSAGRVQSVALRLVCEREAAVERFTPVAYWSIGVNLAPVQTLPSSRSPAEVVSARLTHVDRRRLGPMDISSGDMAEDLARRIQSGPVTVSHVSSRQLQRHPAPPFTTASLQQEAARRLGFGAAKTMRVAQQLYEGAGTGEGLITYMRTDGVQISAEAVEELREANEEMYGVDTVPLQPRQYKGRAKNAQEAHEAIRPTHPATVTPSSLPASLDSDQRALYELIWRRAVASQMTSALYDVVTVDFSADGGSLTLRSSGSLLRQPGFLRAYSDPQVVQGSDEEEEEDQAQLQRQQQQQQQQGGSSSDISGGSGDQDPGLPRDNRGPAVEQLLTLKVGGVLQPVSVEPAQHWTRPPPRYTEASLVKALEERGIGRPSTYAPIMSLLQDRGYVTREGRSLLPTSLGRVLTAFLEHYFPKYVDYDFTSDMEGQLDDVAGGRAAWKVVLSSFWTPFNATVAAMGAIRTAQVYDMLDSALDSYFFRPSASAPAGASAGAGADSETVTLNTQLLPGPYNRLNSSNSSNSSGSSGSRFSNSIDARAIVSPTAVSDPRLCPKCGRGRLVLKPSRFGGFIGCSLYSDPAVACDFARPLLRAAPGGDEQTLASTTASDSESETGGVMGPMAANATERLLGSHPKTGEPVWVRLGPYGLYVQLGDPIPKAPKKVKKARGRRKMKSSPGTVGEHDAGELEVETAKPKRAAISKSTGLTLHTVTLPLALGLLALPRDLGPHPEDGRPVIANSGPFGPYVAHDGFSASLGRRTSALDVNLETAVQLLAAKRARQAGREAQGLAAPLGRGKAASAGAKEKATAGTEVRSRGRVGIKKVAVRTSTSTSKAKGKDSKTGAASGTAAASPRSKSGYTVFLRQRWQEIKAREGERMTYQEAVSLIAAEWRELGVAGQQHFETRTSSSTESSTASEMAASPTRSAAAFNDSTAEAVPAAAAAHQQQPRTTNPYLRFSQQRRPELRAAYPSLGLGEISRLLGAEWGALSEAQKSVYRSGVSP
ncbi:hypothetical protein VaNZ11_007253 [Volvox africanus]|uniref:DNA topoisomerase n=1 Tax=Volvox africanus TaxID=51714 RepID=A0ABQ5S3S6_9CHLO|nr:hypothetical protein VaNZ11_007253 [Volvox africanus]